MATYHTVKQGDCLSSIAKQYGFTDYRTIYDDGNNAQLKQERPDPNLLFPGDRVYIPNKVQKNEPAATGTHHTFELRSSRVFLNLAIHVDQEPLANAEYDLLLGGAKIHGVTDSRGLLREEIETSVEFGKLVFQTPPMEWDLQIGCLDLVNKVTGIQQRLNNLGFACGKADGQIGPRTKAAIRQFQGNRNLKVTGAGNPEIEKELIKDP